MRRLGAVGGAGAVIVERREILAQRREGARPGARVADAARRSAPLRRRFARFGVAGHAAEGDPRLA